jgi:nickel transport protein
LKVLSFYDLQPKIMIFLKLQTLNTVFKDSLIVCVVAGLVAIFAVPPVALAHKLSVFAWVDGDVVKVEGKLPKGKRPRQGHLRVYDGNDQLLLEKAIEADGTAEFPLKDWASGLKIVIDIGGGHQSYWVLTPFDIRQQQKESVRE